MCGRFTRNYTWAQIYAMYSLTSVPSNVEPNFNICPTDQVDVIVRGGDERALIPMQLGSYTELVEETSEGDARRDLQCPLGHHRYQANVPRVVSKATVSDACVGLLRMGRDASW